MAKNSNKITRTKNNKIALLMPYFGKLPIWFDLYLYSCSKNSFIDFIFFTDCDIPSKTYTNTIFHQISFAEYCALISQKLNIKFAPQSPYKLCDVRPFYGIVHADFLQDYDFWGYGDVDVVYGDLTLIVTPRRLAKYDLLSSHADRVAGHFTIVKKHSSFTTICWSIKDWAKRLKEEYVYGIDEHDFTELIHPWNKYIWKAHRIVSKIYKIHPYKFFLIPNLFFNLISRRYIKEFHTTPLPQNGEKWTYDIVSGKICTPTHRKIPYLHFLFFKKTPFWNPEHFWRDDFWLVRIPNYAEACGRIIFDNQKVVYIKQ